MTQRRDAQVIVQGLRSSFRPAAASPGGSPRPTPLRTNPASCSLCFTHDVSSRRLHNPSCDSPGAGRFRQIRGVRLSRSGYERGEATQGYSHGCAYDVQRGPDPVRGLATSAGVPFADWGNGENTPTHHFGLGTPGASLILDGRSPLCAGPAGSLPAGIRKALNARREQDRLTVLVQEWSCTASRYSTWLSFSLTLPYRHNGPYGNVDGE